MDSDVTDSLRSILTDIGEKVDDGNIAEESNRIFAKFNKYFEEDEINPILLDNHLLLLFDKHKGISRFMQVVLSKVAFKKSKIQCLELLYLLVNNCPMKMEKYFREINEICLIFLRNSIASSDEKVRTLTLIFLMLEKININFEYTSDYLNLYKTLCNFLNFKKLGETIAEKIFECLGLYVNKLDFTLKSEDTKNLRIILVSKIIEETRNKDFSKRLVTGLFNGLRHIQERIPFDPMIDKKYVDELYRVMKKLTEDALDVRLKMPSRAGLLFLQKNIPLFSERLYNDHKFWHQILCKWLESLGSEEKKIAYQVIILVYRSVCSHLMERQKPEHQKILKDYLISFRKTLDKQTSSDLHKQVSIKGIGIFFKAAPVQLTRKEVCNFSLKLLHAFRLTYLVDQDFNSDEWSLLPDYIDMVTSVVIAKEIERNEILLLKQSLVVLLRHYSFIPILKRPQVRKVFLASLYAVRPYDFFESFLNDLIYQSVIWSCSYQHISELSEETQQAVTIVTYLPFWRGLLNFELENNNDDWESKTEEMRLMNDHIVEKLISTLFICVDKLDITMKLKENFSTDLKDSIEINKKDDFVIFLNMVDFYERILEIIRPEQLNRYIQRLLNFFQGHSLEFPLNSGFYRLLTVCLKVADKLNYFDRKDGNKDCLKTLSTYMQSLLSKITQYEGELLISSLKVLLECPAIVVEEMLPACISPFITIFTVGRHYLPVADLAIRTLEKWQKSLKHDLMEDFLGKIVEKLDPFLRSRSLAYVAPEFQKRNKTNKALGKRKMAIEIEPELVKLQRKMLRFLGKQASSVCDKMLDSQRMATDVWGDSEHLKMTMPFPDVKLEDVYLDQMIPLVVELALYNSDRKTRVTACELLQALAVLFLGKTKQMPDKTQQESADVLKKFFSAILELGCDPDEVVRALFEPLVMQMIHWYSSPMQSGKCHTAIILEAVIDGVSNPTNANLRLFSGRCAGEFVKWTIKQSTEASLQQNPLNIKVLVRKMRFLSAHPDKFKKLGAALMFNNFYVFLREERSLLSVFWMEIFEVFLSSLHYIEDNFENETIISQIFISLKHLKRGFTEKFALFNGKDEKRRKPHGFTGTTLKDLLNFLLDNVGSKNSLCREKSAELFSAIAPFCSSCKNARDFFRSKDPLQWLKETTSEVCLIKHEISADPQDLLQWMSELHRAIDGLIFLLKNSTMTNRNLNEVLTVKSVGKYLQHIMTADISTSTIFVKKRLEQEKNKINKKLLVLLHNILENKCISENLWNIYLWQLMVSLVFCQKTSLNNEAKSKKDLERFLCLVEEKLPEEKLEDLNDQLKNYLTDNFSWHSELNLPIPPKQYEIMNGMIFLKHCGYNLNTSYPQLVEKFLETCLMISKKTRTINLGEEEVSYYSLVLEFGMQEELKEFLKFLFLPEEIDKMEGGRKRGFGCFLLDTFEDVIIPKMLANFEEFLRFSLGNDCITLSIRYMKKMFTYISRFRGNIFSFDSVLDKLADFWGSYENYFCANFCNLLEGLEFIKILNSAKTSIFLTKSLMHSIVKNKDLLYHEGSLEKNLEVFEFLFENLHMITEEQNLSSIRTALNRVLIDVSQLSDKNSQNLALMNLSKLCNVIGRSRSPILFDFIIKSILMFPDFEQHIKNMEMFERFIGNLSEAEQMETMNISVNYMKSSDYPGDRKMGLGKQILITVFQKVALSAFQQYFLTNIRTLVENLRTPTSQENLVLKMVDFILVEILFARISIGDDGEMNMKLQVAASMDASNAKELLRCFLKCTLSTFKENVVVESKNEEVLRICRCHSYNTMVSIAINSLNDPNFHKKLFTRMKGNEDILWRNLIDSKKIYEFEKDFNSLPQKKKIVVNIRNYSTGQTVSVDVDSKIIRSQRIFNSSLSEDVTRHDMSNVTLRSKAASTETKIEIEMDQVQVNDHECMATVCALINHLNTTIFSNLEDSQDLPSCFTGLRKLLLDETTSTNVKLFLIKVIENTSHVFVNYSKWFLAPVMKFILDKCAGDEMNFFISDLVVMLANWSEKSQPQDDVEQSLANKVIEFLFEKLSTERKDMFKYNLGLIRVLTEAWKDNISISKSFLNQILSTRSSEAEREIHFLSLLLVQNLFIFKKSVRKNFLTFVDSQFNSTKKAVYLPCSEMLGIFLKKIHESNSFESICEEVESIIRKTWESNTDKGGNILEGITIHNPEFLKENHIVRLFSRLGSVIPNSQHTFFKIMLRAIPLLETSHEFRTENWEKYINSESSEVQITVMSLMEKSLHILEKEPSFYSIISAICEKKNSQNELCRKITFDIIMKIFSIHLEDQARFCDVIQVCRDSLIDGLALDNQEIVQTVKNFWINSNILSDKSTERFVQCFSSIYKPKTEDVVLGTGITFLLSLLKRDRDYDKPMFDYPLEDCNFEDYELSVNPSTQQHPYEVPMFAESFLNTVTFSKVEKQFEFGELRATQDEFTFAATVSKEDEAISKFVSSQSSLFSSPRDASHGVFKNPNDYNKSEFKVFKRRFLKSRSKISEHCANFEVRSKMEKVQNRVKVAKVRDRQVSITRKYRKGDFPDIEIPFSAVMEPLKQLASENSDVAKMLYTNLFGKLKETMREANWSDLTKIISTIFRTSLDYNTNLFRVLADFIISSKCMIKLDPYLIAECSLSSSLISTGTLIIENYLMYADQGEPQAKRIKGINNSEDGLHWIKLAELYKELNEWDVVCSIFQNKIPCDDLLSTAISKESKKLWAQAKDSYLEVMEKDLTADNRDFYYEAYFKCVANLGQWQQISETVKSIEGPDCWNTMWQEDWKQKKLLPWYITAQMNEMLFKEELSLDLLENINQALCETRKADHLKSTYPEHIATLWMLNDDLDVAEMYLRSSMDSFLSQWQILDPMFRNIRFKKMLKLRSCTTIYEFIDIYRMFGTVEIEKMFEYLEILWSNTHHKASYPTMLQETSVLYYKQFLSLINSKMASLEDPEYTPYLEKIRDWKVKMDLELIDTALKENNFYLARKYLQSHKTEPGISLYMAKMMFIKSHSANSPAASLETMVKSLKMIENIMTAETRKESILKIHLTNFEIFGAISRIVASNGDLQDNLNEQMRRIIGPNFSSSVGLQDYGASKICEFLEQYKVPDPTQISNKSVSDAHLKVAYYMMEKENPDANILIKMVLRAMKLGASEARLLFPLLLQQEDLGSKYSGIFIHETSTVPTWMFLNWIPQLLANMNSDNIHAIANIVVGITETYPQAIMYPYRLSRDNFNMVNPYLSELVKKIDSSLLNEEFGTFLKAIGNVCIPEKKLKYYVDKMRKNMENVEELGKIQTFILSELYNELPDSNNPKSLLGNAFKRIKKFEKYFQEIRAEKMAELSEKLRENSGRVGNGLLKDYCPWLVNFSLTSMELEIPGQYDGKKMPLPQYHVKIHKFHPEIFVLDSLRKPIKLTILGNDTKEYSYLVKFGEDVRQDQRIQQLFDIMNDIFRKTDNYSQQVYLETFQVIPLTSSLGILKWIDKTIVMGSFLKRNIREKGRSTDAPLDKYVKFMYSSVRRVDSDKMAYGESAKNHDRNKIISNYQKAVNMVDANLLRKAFCKMSTSTESYIALRHNFMRSYAVMCAAHWILGIGDRHLGNTLISLETGRVIGIDFGCAFGSATQMLPVPELIPFRLTPQICSFMEPLGVKGHFRGSMINTMKCLKECKKLLVATMSVFIKEPSLNWLEIPSSIQPSEETSSNWYPNHKINQAKRKLEGINSTVVQIEDLKDGQVQEYLNAYCKLVLGVPEYNYRAKLATEGLSVEEQVDCLIDHAKDYNLLGRTFAGWRPWV